MSTYSSSKLFRALLWLTLSFMVVIYFHAINWKSTSFSERDYGKFYKSAQLSLAHKNPYALVYPDSTIDHQDPTKPISPDLNPPFFVLLITPLGYLPYTISLWVWSLLSIFCSLINVFLIDKVFNPQQSRLLRFILLFSFFIYYPTLANIRMGQVALILTPFFTGAWLAIRNGKPILAALILGFLTSIKPFFGLFFIFFIMHRQWKALLIYAGSVLGCLSLALIRFPPSIYLTYFHILKKITWFSTCWNASLYGLVYRTLSPSSKSALIHAPGWISISFYSLATITCIHLIYWMYRARQLKSASERCDLEFSLISTAMLLLSPLGWLYYFPLLANTILIFLKNAAKHCHFIFYGLTCLGIFLSAYARTIDIPDKILVINPLLTLLLACQYFTALLIFHILSAQFIRLRLGTDPFHTRLKFDIWDKLLMTGFALLPSLIVVLEFGNMTS